MKKEHRHKPEGNGSRPGARRGGAFTLIELLTVIFIISLLIAILIPSLTGARNAAKSTATRAILKSLETGLEMFKTENEQDFRQTNGYPPSFVHPAIRGFDQANAILCEGRFPFVDAGFQPTFYGAMWLPAMLIGYDSLGFVRPSSVPREIRSQPDLWYDPDPLGTGTPLDRQGMYIDPGSVKMKRLRELPGTPNRVFFPDWQDDPDAAPGVEAFPVLVDSFGYPVLYYVASTFGKLTNMVEDRHLCAGGAYPGGSQGVGLPFYFHQDNEGFTGNGTDQGWDFGAGGHAIARSGAALDATATETGIGHPNNKDTFARYILDPNYYGTLQSRFGGIAPGDPLRPVNPGSYLLISTGVDARYGTNDDVTNFPEPNG